MSNNDYGGFTIMLEQSGNSWYWGAYLPSGKPSHFSPMYSTIEGAVDSAKAHIFNLNMPHVVCMRFDQRIVPNTLTEDIPNYESYFRHILENYKDTSTQEEYEPILPPDNNEPPTSPAPKRKNHLTLVE